MNPNPIDTRLTDKVLDLEKRLENIERTRQPYLADWVQLNASDFSYNSSGRIDISVESTAERFTVGDRLKLVQNSTTKYFLVTRADTNHILIAGGDDYTYTSHAITEIYISKNIRPTGFPEAFEYTPTFEYTYLSGSNTITESIDKAEFTMLGNIVYVNLAIGFGKNTTTPDPILIKMTAPFAMDIASNNQTTVCAFGGGSARVFQEAQTVASESKIHLFAPTFAAFNGYLYATLFYITQGYEP